jgi:hypothetical protein
MGETSCQEDLILYLPCQRSAFMKTSSPYLPRGKPASMNTSSITFHMGEAILHEDLQISLHENFLLCLPWWREASMRTSSVTCHGESQSPWTLIEQAWVKVDLTPLEEICCNIYYKFIYKKNYT